MQNYAQRPHVYFCSVPIARQDFRGHIIRRSYLGFEFSLARLMNLRESKINNFEFIVFAYHDIFRFQIPMTNSMGMAVVYRPEESLHDLNRLLFRVDSLLIDDSRDLIIQISTLTVLHDEVDVFVVLVLLVILYDIWVV